MKKRLSMLLVLALVIGLLGAVPVWAEEIPDVTAYSYTVTPVLSPFAYYLYVKTDNPDPTSFRLVDRESKFYDADSQGEIRIQIDGGYSLKKVDPGTYYISQNIYADVVYEDESIYRVPGGYIFLANGAFSDGGEFALLQKTRSGSSILSDTFEETEVTIPCQPLNTRVGYLIDTCTTEEMSFFEKLDAVQSRLNQIAVYPRTVYDINDPNEDRPYPFLASSPYPELGLNDHYSMFNPLEGGILASNAYPFILDSASFPGTMRTVAKQLEPDCETASTSLHWLVDITFDGETHSYGGAGTGGYDPLYSNRVQQVFTFSGEDDFGTHGTIDGYYTLLRGYEPVAVEDAEKYRDLIQGTTFCQTIQATGGTWIRIAVEGFGLGTSFGYAVPLGTKTMIMSDAWVDGRYIGNRERIVLNEKFEDHPTADIVLHDVTYTDRNNETHTQDVVYSYDETKDAWTAPYFYSGSYSYSSAWQLPDELILTREQVEAMTLDYNSSHWPQSGLVYDGKEYPGTPFTMKLTTGVSVPETLELYVGQSTTIEAAVEPADAFDTRVTWTSSDPSVVEVSDYSDWIQAVGEGTAVLTAVTVDGGYTASCTVTVLPDPCANGHSYAATVTEPTCTDWGYTTYTCTFCDDSYKDTYVSPLGHAWDDGVVTTQPTETEPGEKTYTCTRCGETRTERVPELGHVHQYVDTVTAPTCTEQGYTTHTCECGDSYKDSYVEALGHAWDDGVVTVQPTQTSPGEMTYTCTRCGATFCTAILAKILFSDVDESQYYYTPVMWAVENAITQGTGATTFSPDEGCTRAQVVTFLWRAAGQPEPAGSSNPFRDVQPDAYYYKAVLWAVENRITAGTSATTFSPDDTCTRAQIVTFLWRYEGEPAPKTAGNPFADVASDAYYAKAVLWASETGVTAGTSATTFSPNDTCTRAQVVTFLYRDAAK